MILFFFSIAALLISGIITLAVPAKYRSPTGTIGVLVAAVFGLVPSVAILFGSATLFVSIPWQIPLGALSLQISPLNSLFLVPLFIVAALCAIFGQGYLGNMASRSHWFFYNLLVGSIAIVVTAFNGILFLVAWELMALSSFFLVMTDHHKPEVRSAGFLYFAATHVSGLFVVAFFCVLGTAAGSLDFSAIAEVCRTDARLADIAFILALLGFGTKAGFMPLHIWLPEAHPAAPSHVSALLSGVMIKTGIYGVLLFLSFGAAPSLWWGWVLLAIGLSSSMLGILHALGQHDLKRVLAYSSVKGIGIITLGLGLGLCGISYGQNDLAMLGFCGALFYVVNHALFKALLFLGAGSLLHATHDRLMDTQGGLNKKMPLTAICFCIGSIAIVGLPPLNGFVPEVMLFLGAFSTFTDPATPVILLLAGIAVAAALAFTGSAALACFVRAYGSIFLGEPRSKACLTAKESGFTMVTAQISLAIICVVTGFASPFLMEPVIHAATRITANTSGWGATAVATSHTLFVIGAVALAFLALVVLLVFIRPLLGARHGRRSAYTWDCGFRSPTPKMQYTASSFAEPFMDLFTPILRNIIHNPQIKGPFPAPSTFMSSLPDFFGSTILKPLYANITALFSRIRPLQRGGIHRYVLSIVIVLVILLMLS